MQASDAAEWAAHGELEQQSRPFLKSPLDAAEDEEHKARKEKKRNRENNENKAPVENKCGWHIHAAIFPAAKVYMYSPASRLS